MSRDRAHATRTKRSGSVPAWLEFVILIVAAVLVAVGIKAFFVQMYFVPSSSMTPLLQVNDRILVEKVSYWTGSVKRGDVVVFKDPGGWLADTGDSMNAVQKALSTIGLYPTGGHLVKRVIGVAGDHVVCCDAQGRVTVNGVPLSETDYILEGTVPSDRPFDVTVPDGKLWVMGDNRDNSEDSRYHGNLDGGFVPTSDVVGKVWAVVWPFKNFQRVHTPGTFGNIDLQLATPGS